MMSNSVPYYVPQEPGKWKAITLALIVHAVLLAFLWFGINWANDKPETIEAEVWSPQELEKAPPPVQPPEPEPIVKPAPEVKETPAVEDPDIALERDKKAKRLEKEKHDEELAAEKQKANEKAAAEKEKADKKLADDKKKTDDQKKLADDKRKEDALAKKIHDETMRTMNSDNKSPDSGNSDRSQGSLIDSGWLAHIKAKIKSNTHVLVSSEDNAPVEFEITLFIDGSLKGQPIMKKSSGIPEFDDAVRRGIEQSQPFPPDKTGTVPKKPITIVYRPKD